MSVENLVPIAQAPRLFPGPPHVQTVRRWANEGVRGHKLETVRVGGKLFVTPEQAQRFIASGNDAGATSCS